MNRQTLIVMQSTLITSIISIVFRLPHSGAVFLFPKLTDREKIRKFFQGLKSTEDYGQNFQD